MALQTHTLPAGTEYELEEFTPRERLTRSGGWLAVTLAVLLMFTVGLSVEGANWTDGLGVVQPVLLGGAILGALLALTRWTSAFATLYGLVAGLAWITHLLVTELIKAKTMQEGITTIVGNVSQWVSALIGGTASGDAVVFVVQVCLLGWWLAFFAMWNMVRHQRVWLAIVPAGVALFINAYYAPNDVTGYVLVFLVLALLLAIRVELARNETRWRLTHVRYAPDMYLDFIKEGLIFSVVVVVLAWSMPSLGVRGTRIDEIIQPIQQPWRQMQDTWQRMFTTLRYKPGPYVSTYGKSLQLSGPVSLTDRPVFQAAIPQRSYWRGAAYDSYTGLQWLNTDPTVIGIERGNSLPERGYKLTKEITATIQTRQPGQDVLFGAPQPVRATLPLNADVTVIEAGPTRTQPREALSSLMRSRIGLDENSVYQVASRVTIAPPEALRNDSTEYPQWVIDRFLQAPDDMPARVAELARQETEGLDNPYDKAAALEAFLRTYAYDTQIPAPPAGADGVDYFLFDVKAGYCDYYASALVMMLRSLGVPARFVAGYAPGTYVEDAGVYVVLEQDAHAWVEVFFPSYGWIQFEPTASQPQLARPEPLPAEDNAETIGGGDTGPGDWEEIRDLLMEGYDGGTGGAIPVTFNPIVAWIGDHWPTLLATLAALGLAFAAWRLLSKRQARLLNLDGGLLLRLFGVLSGWAERLNLHWPASHTPLEHAHVFGSAVPEAKQPVERLMGVLVAQQYGRQDPTPDTLASAAGDWRTLQPLLWKNWAERWIHMPDWKSLAQRIRQGRQTGEASEWGE